MRTIQNLSYAGTVKAQTKEYVEIEVGNQPGLSFLIPAAEIREIIMGGKVYTREEFLKMIPADKERI
ncbi:MAG: hypothetical protein LUF00_13600 [Lachnospiraceae bacterium]|nr:hypothetical protein [Lachnospiraceae bacterium]